jgi:hypothetical protein
MGKRGKVDANGVPIGRAHANPILDTRVFEVEFLDGHIAAMTANAIDENLMKTYSHKSIPRDIVYNCSMNLQIIGGWTRQVMLENRCPVPDACSTTNRFLLNKKPGAKNYL